MPWAVPGKDTCLELSVFRTAEWGQENRPRQPGGPLQREGHWWARSCTAKVSAALWASQHSAKITTDQEPEDRVHGGNSATGSLGCSSEGLLPSFSFLRFLLTCQSMSWFCGLIWGWDWTGIFQKADLPNSSLSKEGIDEEEQVRKCLKNTSIFRLRAL